MSERLWGCRCYPGQIQAQEVYYYSNNRRTVLLIVNGHSHVPEGNWYNADLLDSMRLAVTPLCLSVYSTISKVMTNLLWPHEVFKSPTPRPSLSQFYDPPLRTLTVTALCRFFLLLSL